MKAKRIVEWIKNNLKTVNQINKSLSSYQIKTMIEQDLNIYIEHDEFKALMVSLGFKPEKNVINHYYNVACSV